MNNINIHKKSLSPFCTFKDEVWMVKHGPPILYSFYAAQASTQKHQVFPFIMQSGNKKITECNTGPLQTDVLKPVVSV